MHELLIFAVDMLKNLVVSATPLVLTILLGLLACTGDQSSPERETLEASVDSSDLDLKGNQIHVLQADGTKGQVVKSLPMPGVSGFNYLSDCDSLSVSRISLSEAVGGKSVSYLVGACVTNKSYELLLVPRSQDAKAMQVEDVGQVFAEAQQAQFADYIPYAMLIPQMVQEDVRSNSQQIMAILPSNIAVYRFDRDRKWHEIGVEEVTDANSLNALRWKLAHDQPLTHSAQ